MATGYDRKFEEMKQYIPFLESMIERLENTSGGPGSANPRQAQLDKIRSLRDLLFDKKKRMKMENLLKCEQVLLNLYSKVEQRDTLPGIRPVSEVFPSSSSNSDSDLHAVRNKLKIATSKPKIKEEETLPEIARRSEMEESCTPGSKEPALFQRRPNKAHSPSRSSSVLFAEKISFQKSGSRRNYTRVLVSPEPNRQRWSIGGEDTTHKPLFSRRSPRRSPKRHSPSYKKEKRKSSNANRHTKDLNITINVPQDSLDSLNTDDIVSRIINCDDNDVDIATLRDLRTQILGELKQTGASDDISDIIMKSYKTKKNKNVINVRKRDEIEEGELSDSESEAIESIYGSLVVVDKDKTTSVPSGTKDCTDKEIQSRKIQICLVINSDKDDKGQEMPKATDVSDFEMFDDVDIAKPTEKDKEKDTMRQIQKTLDIQNKMERLDVSQKQNASKQVVITIGDDDEMKKIAASQITSGNLAKPITAAKESEKDSDSSFIDFSSTSEAENSLDKTKEQSTKTPACQANFYKPLHDKEIIKISKNTPEISGATQLLNKESSLKSEPTTEIKTELTSVRSDDKNNVEKEKGNSLPSAKSSLQNKVDIPESEDLTKNVEIPLLNTEPVVASEPVENVLSEIDILQALKNEILSESIAIPGAEGSTPLLHQPKVTKVANTQEIINKKRISIEKYKQKSNSTSTSSLFMNEPNVSSSKHYDYGKKQSLKLTEEECERFNFPKKLALNDSSDEDDKDDDFVDDIYGDLAPKSPENDDVSTVGSSTPIIIPEDPIKPTVVSSKIDVDMRTLMPILSPNAGKPLPVPPPPLMSILLPVATMSQLVETKPEQNKRPLLMDPRVRRDFNKPMSKNSPNPHTSNSERSRPSNYGNMTPNRTPNARTYEMTPSHQSFDLEDNPNRKHVYAPLPAFELREREPDGREISTPVWETNIDSAKQGHQTHWEDRDDRDGPNLRSYWEEHERKSDRWDDSDRRGSSTRDVDYQKSRYEHSDRYQHSRSDRYSNDQIDDYYWQECPRTPSHPFGRVDRPTTPNPSFGRHEAPMTPIHPFGRSDCPTTPSHPFGRSDHPQTPSHAFGRNECSMTPSHPFGRTDAPLTPSHHFGRTDCPMTPSHPFGRSECPMTPSHPFGRNDRNMAPMTPSHPFGRSDYQQNQPIQKFKDPRLNRSTEYDSQRRDDDKDRYYYRDRKKSDNSNRSHNASISYFDYSREQSVGRNDRDTNCEQRRQIRERTPHRESSVGRGLPKDSERFYTRRETDRTSAKDICLENCDDSKMNYQRASSVGRTHPPEDRYRRFSYVPPNMRKKWKDANKDKTLSVKPQSGRSFVIDTSVNRTFQEFLNDKGLQMFDHSFASRRQRAASVGRTITREPSIERTTRESSVEINLPKPTAATHNSLDNKRMVNFVRARSVSRDFGDKKQQKSLDEIKADFQSYSANYNKKKDQKGSSQTIRSRKEVHQMHHVKQHQESSIKTTYSPRKNQNDSRMRRNQHYDHKNRNRHEKKNKDYGIVYSSDNIAKGTILGSGYGVRNYKIPKIKRPVEEIIKEDPKVLEQQKKETEKGKVSTKKNNDARKKIVDKTVKDEDKELEEAIIAPKVNKKENNFKFEFMEDKKRPKEKNKAVYDKIDNENTSDDSIKRSTRSSKKCDVVSKVSVEVPGPKTRRVKKVIIESDSDSEVKEVKQVDTNESKVGQTNENMDLFNSSFGIYELGIFSGNSGVVDVEANINDLIADLDKELENNKSAEGNNRFTQELSLENMLQNINSPETENLKEESLQDISELINKDFQDAGSKPSSFDEMEVNLSSQANAETTLSNTVNIKNNVLSKTEEQKINEVQIHRLPDKFPETKITSTKLSKVFEESNKVEEDSSNDPNKLNNESIVSTTIKGEEQKNDEKLEDTADDLRSTPDSTINTSDKVLNKYCEESLPDSTNELHTNSSDITSTHDACNKDTLETNSLSNDSTSQIDSLGNLLSILQNKSKIKELLCMLEGKSSDNDKIMKKLEKLKELVSDEEDTNDTVDQNKPKEMPNQNELHVVEDIKEPQNKPPLPIDSSEVHLETHEKDTEKADEAPAQDEPGSDDKDSEEHVKITPKKKIKGKSGRKARKSKLKAEKKIMSTKAKRITRSGTVLKTRKPKASRELRQLQNDIKEMFISDDILNATGIRMCRLAKLVDEKPENHGGENTSAIEPKPVVVLQKFKENELLDDKAMKIKKKPGPKPKPKVTINENISDVENKTEIIKTPSIRRKPGPKSKTKISQDESDPYAFESDSVSDINTPQPSEDMQNSSESESESLASSKSFESTEALADLKKKKRKRRSGWSSGVIAKRKKKIESKQKDSLECELSPEMLLQKKVSFPDMSCFVDKTYCFYRNISTYPCRLCEYSGSDIIHHYKKQHSHSEIPLSRMNATAAREAIEQCEDIDFNAMSRLPSDKFICRFCNKEIYGKRALLETFFWHVVSMHTGEYKQLCPQCVNVVPCPFNLDIPPPPKDIKGQLIGYICGKCNFAQISLENLKIHVIVRHNDEQTEVYTINLAVMTKKTLAGLMKRQSNISEPRLLRSRTNVSATEASSDRSDDLSELTDISYQTSESKKDSDVQNVSIPKISVHSKLTFESDDTPNLPSDNIVKIEKEDNHEEMFDDAPSTAEGQAPVSDILDYPHFKISFKDAGAKEYICCINGNDNHYKTSLLISMKKHVQTKHSENWDGYCFVCKVIVMPQGKHSFRDCLQHMLDKHIDSFPVLANIEITAETTSVPSKEGRMEISYTPEKTTVEEPASTKSYINVRPLCDLMAKEIKIPNQCDSDALPKIQSVISLGATSVEPSIPSSTPPDEKAMQEMLTPPLQEQVRYEEAQAEIMSKKHRVVIDAMLVPEKLIQIFKCAGRFCSFTTDSAEAALVHASTHQRIGGENALMCAYCDSDSKGNGIDLITHVFKNHGYCHYACGYCFYRAAASQLVRAHMIRAHGPEHGQSVVYRNSVTVTTNEDKADILPRNLAVQYYICAAAGCKFKTFTQGKFTEHLMKHEPPHSCHICSSSFPSPVEVIQHLKTHGLMLYQCTWCVYGAENEGELLAHASANHPSKIPQAYLRVITQKDGNASKMMVLPLAQLNKSIVQVKVLTAANRTEDPSREAQRSIDLEKLIGSVILPIMENTATLTVVPDKDPIIECSPPLETNSEVIDQIRPGSILTDDSEMATLIPDPPRVVTPVPPTAMSAEGQDLSHLTPVLKTEPTDETPIQDNPLSAEVICLDSDEEDFRDTAINIISLSDDDTATATEKLKPEDNHEKFSASELYKCSRCTVVYKSPQAFKRHITSCLSKMDKYNCAHCPKTVNDLDELLKHYNHDHATSPKLRRQRTQTNTKDQKVQNYVCGICDHKGCSLYLIKSHLKNYHGVTNVIVASKHLDNGGFLYTVREAPATRPKRKLSAGSASEQTPPKRKRYHPRDLNQLPTRPIFDEPAFCSECEFSTKVLSNLVRHLQQHADAQAVPSTVPVNPVPHLETNERHFDKMINLASSSLVNKSDKPSRNDKTPSVTLMIPPEAASRYPKYVPERRRHTCGAKDCSYISVDEAMLKCHWETLHAESNNFHCAHCPPYQHLDTSIPLTAARIVGHLKMHDVQLYGCSSCLYYHYKRQVLEKHVVENHNGSGQVMVVREEASSQVLAGVTQPATPTMDLKPWQCGLCKYKNMLRQEVIEHCSKVHNSKWQFKCPVCQFRGSTLENVSNHQSRVHPESCDDVFYYYYREGSFPEEANGIPRWQKQRQIINPKCEVKTESQTGTDTPATATTPSAPASVTIPKSVVFDLNLVKREVVDTEVEESIEQLYKRFGLSCNPNGLKYKCPLCKIVIEDSKDAMQSHLYEELQYRKWGCSICTYKAFHKTGLNEHMFIEHNFRQVLRNEEFIELPTDVNIEKWVTHVLDHQTDIIVKNKENLDNQKIQIPKPDATATTTATTSTTTATTTSTTSFKTIHVSDNVFGPQEFENLSKAFGKLGSPKNIDFCCPKCDLRTRDENEMKNHLELELNKIRWRCSSCSDYSQNYHEAQLHCKTCKNLRPGQSARPIEAIRDPSMRAAWVSAVIHIQKQAMKQPEDASTSSAKDDQSNVFDTIENSLLAVRYERNVPTPEEEMLQRKKGTSSTFIPSVATTPDSDDERLVIDEPTTDEAETPPKKKIDGKKKCKYCDFSTKYRQAMYTHTLRHYNLMPCICAFCGFTCHKNSMVTHFANYHPGEPEKYTKTAIPSGPPLWFTLEKKRSRRSLSDDYIPQKKEKERSETALRKEEEKLNEEASKTVCLVCEKVVSEAEKSSHFHDKFPVTYAKKGKVVVKCCICLALLIDNNALQDHHTANHPDTPVNYAYFKLNYDTREIHYCGYCRKRFKFIRDLRTHHNTLHCSLSFKYESKPFTPGFDLIDNEQESTYCVKKNDSSVLPPPKRVARKSTTKLPNRTVARKSTTKLPLVVLENSDMERENFSYYGTKPTPIEQLDKVNLLMSLSNTIMPMSMTLRKLSEIMEIDPKVIVEDCKK